MQRISYSFTNLFFSFHFTQANYSEDQLAGKFMCFLLFFFFFWRIYVLWWSSINFPFGFCTILFVCVCVGQVFLRSFRSNYNWDFQCKICIQIHKYEANNTVVWFMTHWSVCIQSERVTNKYVMTTLFVLHVTSFRSLLTTYMWNWRIKTIELSLIFLFIFINKNGKKLRRIEPINWQYNAELNKN